MSNGVPPPPDLREAIHKHRGTSLTLVEQATVEFEAYLRASGGKLRPLSASDLGVPAPPDLGAALKDEALRRDALKSKERK